MVHSHCMGMERMQGVNGGLTPALEPTRGSVPLSSPGSSLPSGQADCWQYQLPVQRA